MTARRLLALVTPRDDTREHHRIALHVEEFLTYTFREVDRGNEKRRGAHTERVSATHTPRGAVGRGANRWDPKRGGGESRRRREMGPAQNGGGPKIGNPRGEDSATWGPRIEGGLEPGIAKRHRDEAALRV